MPKCWQLQRTVDLNWMNEGSNAELRTNAGKGESEMLKKCGDGRHVVELKPRRRTKRLRRKFRVLVFPWMLSKDFHTQSRGPWHVLLCGGNTVAEKG